MNREQFYALMGGEGKLDYEVYSGGLRLSQVRAAEAARAANQHGLESAYNRIVFQVAEALGVSVGVAQARLNRLTAQSWRGTPLLHRHASESGLETYAPSRALVGEQEAAEEVASPAVVNLPIPSFREEIIAHSRQKYARPRAEVERLVPEQLGHAPEEYEDTPEGD